MGSYNELTPGIVSNKLAIIDKNGQLRDNYESTNAQANYWQALRDEIYLQYEPKIEVLEKKARTSEESMVSNQVGSEKTDKKEKVSGEDYQKLMNEINDLEEEESKKIEQINEEESRQETRVQMENEMLQSQIKQLEADTEGLESARTKNAEDKTFQ